MPDAVRKLIHELTGLIVFFPLVILTIWAANIALKYYAGKPLSHLQNIIIGVVVSAVILNFFPKTPRRGAVMAGVAGYIMIALALWMFG